MFDVTKLFYGEWWYDAMLYDDMMVCYTKNVLKKYDIMFIIMKHDYDDVFKFIRSWCMSLN